MNSTIIENIRKKLSIAGFLPLEKQAQLSTEVLQHKLETVLPEAMEKSGVDFWLIVGKEYNEDPVMETLFTWDMPHARRISALAFYYDRSSGKVRRMSAAASSPEMDKLYENVKVSSESVWECISRIVSQYEPEKIAVNRSENYGFCDGLSSSSYDSLLSCLRPEYHQRLCSAEDIAIRWLQKITGRELELMKVMVDVTKDIIRMSFSRASIHPGITSTSDIEWLMRNTISQLGFDYWFGPDVDLQRRGSSCSRMSESIIEYGDLLHCDIGISGKYIKLNTDMQWVAYMLEPDEKHAPKGLTELLACCSRFQDIVISNFKNQLSGNELFANAILQAKKEGLKPMLYTHPLGTFGHGAGPLIGIYDNQGFVEVKGERPVENSTCYALELNISGSLPEWDNQEVFIYMEEDICFNDKASFVQGRETGLIEI